MPPKRGREEEKTPKFVREVAREVAGTDDVKSFTIYGFLDFWGAFGGKEEFEAFMIDDDKRPLIEPLYSEFLNIRSLDVSKKFRTDDVDIQTIRFTKRKTDLHAVPPVIYDSFNAELKELVDQQEAILEKCRDLKKGWTLIPVGGKTPSPTKMTAAEANEIMRQKKENDKAINDSMMDKESQKRFNDNERAAKKLSKKLRKQKEKEAKAKGKDVGGGGI